MATLGAGIISSCVDSSGNVAGGQQGATADTALIGGEVPDIPYSARARHLPPPPKPKEEPSFERGYGAGCPRLMVRIGDFCIDRFEAYVVELKAGKEEPHLHSVHPHNDQVLMAKVAYRMYPQGSISRPQAEQACQNAGKRLCTMAQWKLACRGAEGSRYPYGPDEEPGKCNTRKTHLVTQFFGTDPMKWGNGMNDPLLNMIKGYLARGYEHPACVSGFGAYDMVGNLHEWVSDLVTVQMVGGRANDEKPEGGEKRKPRHPLLRVEPGNGIFMGGFFSNSNENGEGCSYTTMAHGVQHYDYSTGFRCCRDADSNGK